MKKIFVAAVYNEKAAIVKTSVGATGTMVSPHDIQIIVGVATLIFMIMQIIVMIPKVQAALRQMAADRERQRQQESLDFPPVHVSKKDRKRLTLSEKVAAIIEKLKSLFERVKRFFHGRR